MRRLLGGAAALLALTAIGVYVLARMPLSSPIGVGPATLALAAARGALLGDAPSVELAKLGDGAAQPLPVILSLFDHGEPVARGVGRGATFGAALNDAVTQLRRLGLDRAVITRGRLKLDRVVGRGFLSSNVAPLFALGAVPGRDGIGVIDRGRETYLTNDDLTRARLWSGYQPLPMMEFAMGIDVQKTVRVLARLLEQGPRWRPTEMFRFRAEEYVEPASPGAALPILAGHPPGPELNRASLAAGARAGGAFLLAHLDGGGRFDYEYYTIEDSRVTAGYSIPRHAGAASFLSQLYALDHDAEIRLGAERALDALTRMRPPGCDGDRLCVGDLADRVVDLGSTALALVAVSEYQRTTGDARYAVFARGLAEFVLYMQKPDGDFCHLYDAQAASRDQKTQLLYYSGEAAYGLARLLALGDAGAPELAARAAPALDRALAYLTDGAYASFASQFYIGEDHWTCMALDAGWDRLPVDHREKYARFCDEFSRFLRRSQMRPGESLVEAQPQLAGAYGITAMLAPHSTPVGSRSETTISMWRIARKRNLAPTDPRVVQSREQVLDGMRFLLDRQIRDDGAYLAGDPVVSRGGIPMSDVERHVRIDFIQHSCSAMLRALEML